MLGKTTESGRGDLEGDDLSGLVDQLFQSHGDESFSASDMVMDVEKLVKDGQVVMMEGSPPAYRLSDKALQQRILPYNPPASWNTSQIQFDLLYDSVIERFRGRVFAYKEFMAFVKEKTGEANSRSILMKMVRFGVVMDLNGHGGESGTKRAYKITRAALEEYAYQESRRSQTAGQPARQV